MVMFHLPTYQVKFGPRNLSGVGDRLMTFTFREVPSKEMCQKVEDVILQDHRVKVSDIAHELSISAGTVSSIIHSVLMMSKISSRWVPRMLTPELKVCQQQFSQENLDTLRANPENFFSRILQGWNMGPSS